MFSPSKIKLLENANEKLRIHNDLNVEKNKNIVFVYSPPKVGSTSLISSIRLFACNKFTTLHVHSEGMLKILCGITGITILDIIKYNKMLGKNIFVIDIYRSPIEQKISTFFENITDFHFNVSDDILNTYPIQKIITRFNNIFLNIQTDDYYKTVYNINQVHDSFDFENKYIMTVCDDIKYIKLRLKDVNDWGIILNKLLNINVIIIKDYETKKKKINTTFSKFKNVYKIPKNLLEIVKNCPHLNFYYSPTEINEYISNWEKKSTYNVKYFSQVEYDIYHSISSENQYKFNVQKNHYMDMGCTCKACSIKRNKNINKIIKGDLNIDKIIHDDSVVELKTQIYKKVEEINSKLSRITKITKIKNPNVNNVFTSIVNR